MLKGLEYLQITLLSGKTCAEDILVLPVLPVRRGFTMEPGTRSRNVAVLNELQEKGKLVALASLRDAALRMATNYWIKL